MVKHPEQPTSHPDTTQQLVEYYDQLATRYDSDRFGHSYGRYLHAQELRLLQRWLGPIQGLNILDLACGTGRFLQLASHGLDASPAMTQLAQHKHPHKIVQCGLAKNLSEMKTRFAAIFCLHLFMHQTKSEVADILQAAYEQLHANGRLIFDVPSAQRRSVTAFQPFGWHAGTAFRHRELLEMTAAKWRCREVRGVLFFPIHRLPARLRPALRRCDDLLGATPLKMWSSYLFYCLERHA